MSTNIYPLCQTPEQQIEILHQKTEDKCIPLNTMIELTYNCNLRCQHCYVVKDQVRKELSSAEIKKLLDRLAEEGCLFLTLTGGEILTREDFFDIAAYAQGNGFALRLFTNGTLLTSKTADQIAKLNPLSVELSIYGTTPELHDAITQTPGSFEKLLQAINLLRERNLRLTLKSMLMKTNLYEYRALLNLAKEFGSNCLFGVVITKKNDGSPQPTRFQLSEDALTQLFSELNSLASSPSISLPTLSPAEKEVCSAGKNICSISPYGDVYPCVQLLFSFGNIREKAFSEIWHSSLKTSSVRSIKTYSDLPECSNCHLIQNCRRCPGLAMLETGNLRSKSSIDCMLARVGQAIKQTVEGRCSHDEDKEALSEAATKRNQGL